MAERKPINYMTESNYNTSTSPGYSTVTLTSDTNELKYDGVNIVKNKKSVGVGDVLLNDGTWMDGTTIPDNDSTTLNKVVGVVINRKGNKVLLHSVKGFNGSDSTNNINSTSRFINSIYDTNNNISNFASINTLWPSNSNVLRKCGTSSSRAGVNYNQLYSRLSGGPYSDTWRDTDSALGPGFASKYNYENAVDNGVYNNINLKTMYSSFETYLKDQMLDYPKLSGIFGIAIGKAHEWTKNMARYEVASTPVVDSKCQAILRDTPITNLANAAFLPAVWANNLTEGIVGEYNLGAGKWYLIGIEELFEWFSNQKILDKTQKVFTKLNSNNAGLVSSSRWCCARYNNSNAWLYGNYGLFVNGAFSITYRVSAVMLLEL